MGLVVAGFALSASLFSGIAHVFFPGNTSGLLLTLAVGTATPMVVGLFLVRPCPYPEYETQTDVESNGEESASPCFIPDETSGLIVKNLRSDPPHRPDLNGLAMVRTIDFWVLFGIASLRKYFRSSEAEGR